MGFNDYSSMEDELLNAPQPYVLGKGKEVKAMIIQMKVGTSEKNDARYLMPSFNVPDEPLALPFNDFFWDPLDYSKVDPSQVAVSKAKFSNFIKAFGIDLKGKDGQGIDWETDPLKKFGWLVTGPIQEDTGYGEKASVSRYIAGPDGQATAPGSGGNDPF